MKTFDAACMGQTLNKYNQSEKHRFLDAGGLTIKKTIEKRSTFIQVTTK